MPAPDVPSEASDIARSPGAASARPATGTGLPLDPGMRRSRPIYRVFVSSTWLDLQPERRALMEALNRMEEMRFVGMEFFGNRPDDTHDASIDQVDKCELLVGVIGHRYGSGITEAEYRRARELGIPCFIYFKRGDTLRPELTDGDAALAAKLAAFKQDLLRGHTVKEFTSPEELAANATADLHNWVAARWISLERGVPPDSRAPVAAPADAERTNTLRLLERIQHDWIEGVLDSSLHRRAWMDLGLDWRDEAIEQPWDRILVAPDRPVQTLGERDTIAGVFAAAQNTLLVLGEPGAGKTTTLLELARELVRRARESSTEPAPVVLALSTWTGRHRALGEWLGEELNVRYQVPKRLASAWLDAGRLVLLLDGLDEVREDARAACVEAINAFAQEHSPAGLAVTCRVVEYSALKERLRLRSAICLQPLTPRQIDAYFERAGAGLENLRAAMRDDGALRELAQTPLMLSVMTMAWRDAPAESLRAGDKTTVEQRRNQLLDAYVQTALRRKGVKEAEGFGRQMLQVLPWLAGQMRTRGQTLFAVEQLQPDWLDGRKQQQAYFLITRVLASLALALPFLCMPVAAVVKGAVVMAGVVVGGVLGAVDFSFFLWQSPRFGTPGNRSLVTVLLGGFIPLLLGPLVQFFVKSAPPLELMPSLAGYGVLIAATLSRMTDVKVREIMPADAMGWSWRQSCRRAVLTVVVWQGVLTITFLEYLLLEPKGWRFAVNEFGVGGTGYWYGIAGGAIIAAAMAWRRKWTGRFAVAATVALMTLGADVGQLIGTHGSAGRVRLWPALTIAFLVALFGGFTAVIDDRRARRTGTWFWIKVPLLTAGAVGSVVAATLGGIFFLTGSGPSSALPVVITAAFGGGLGLIAFFRFGGFQGVQHFVLRRLLVHSGRLPKNPTDFLDHAARLNLLQKVGFGYRFVHALLLDHLAARAPEAGEKPSPSASGR